VIKDEDDLLGVDLLHGTIGNHHTCRFIDGAEGVQTDDGTGPLGDLSSVVVEAGMLTTKLLKVLRKDRTFSQLNEDRR
jgi:hypothetical protein